MMSFIFIHIYNRQTHISWLLNTHPHLACVFVSCLFAGNQSSISLSYCHSWKRKSSSHILSHGNNGKKKQQQRSGSEKGPRGSWQGSGCSDWASLDAAMLDTQINMEREKGSEGDRGKEKEQGGSTSSSLLTCEDWGDDCGGGGKNGC